jgi:AraC-like DNA-binding protein
MGDIIETVVERVIRALRENLGEQITIDDMARTAMFSKFHFSRIFQRTTGVSPGRFLSALRLQEAKRLLLTTSMTVADISHLVGYNSIGTFSSRFRSSVGVSPTEYRQYRGTVEPLAMLEPVGDEHRAIIRGSIWQAPGCRPGHIVVGLFPDRIAQGTPVRHSVLPTSGRFEIANVPAGTWYLLAHSVEIRADLPTPGEPYVAAFGPVDIGSGTELDNADLWLRPRRIFDPPTLLAQLDRAMWAAPTGALAAADRVGEDVALPGA